MSRWLILTGLADNKSYQGREAEGRTGSHQSITPPLIIEPSADPGDAEAAKPKCVDYDGKNVDCTKAGADATIKQARDADWQTYIFLASALISLLTLVAAAAAACFAKRAATETGRSAKAARKQLKATQKMNIAAVRPHVYIDRVSVAFDFHTNEPTIGFYAENVSAFTAYDWEWMPVLRYGVRKSPRHPWGKRGVSGMDLKPNKPRSEIPGHITFPLNDAEASAASTISGDDALHVSLTILTRCFDAFDNPVYDRYYFFAAVKHLSKLAGRVSFALQAVPRGTHIEGEED